MFKKFLGLNLLCGSLFGLTLQEAINTALKQNPTIKAEKYHYLSSKEDYYSQIAKRFGEVDLFWNYIQYKYSRIVAPIKPPITPTSLAKDDQVRVYGFRYRVRLFDGCQQFFLIKAKGHTADLYFTKFEDTAKSVERDVKKLYLSILALKAKLKALRERKKAVSELYKIVLNAYKIGKKPLLDLLNVKAELKLVDAKISAVQSQIDKLKGQLAALLNIDKTFKVEDVKVSPKRFEVKQFLDQLLANNPKLKEIRVQRKVADDYKKVALAEFSPKVNFSYTDQKYVYAGRKTSDWSYAIAVSFPLFDFGNRFFNYRKARYLERRVNELQRAVLKKVLETYKALIKNLNSQVDIIEANSQRLEFAKEAYKVEKERYLTGKGDIYDLLKAEALYYTALGEYKASIYQWGVLKAELDYLIGN